MKNKTSPFVKGAGGILLLLLIAASAHAEPEKFYQTKWCNEHGGEMEVVLPDRSRVDCLLDDYAIEVEFAANWKESVGQSLHYASRTGRIPGIVLIIERESDWKYFYQLLHMIAERNLDHKVWVINRGPGFVN